jgi:hypothetical protein
MPGPVARHDGPVAERQITRKLRALCVAVDAKGYSKLATKGQHELQKDLLGVLDAAAADARLDRMEWSLQPQGDGELAVLPGDQDERLVVDAFVRHLDAQLTALNEDRLPEARLRLRIAVHHGVAISAPNGYSGPAPVHVSRLLSSAALHEALENSRANLVLALSESYYEELVLSRLTSLREEDFRLSEIDEEKFQGGVWIHVPFRSLQTSADDSNPDGASGSDPVRSASARVHAEATITADTVDGKLTGVEAELSDHRGAEIKSELRLGAIGKTGDVYGVRIGDRTRDERE